MKRSKLSTWGLFWVLGWLPLCGCSCGSEPPPPPKKVVAKPAPPPPPKPAPVKPPPAPATGRLSFEKAPIQLKREDGSLLRFASNGSDTGAWPTMRGLSPIRRMTRCTGMGDVIWSDTEAYLWKGDAPATELPLGIHGTGTELRGKIRDVVWDGKRIWIATDKLGLFGVEPDGKVAVRVEPKDLPPWEHDIHLLPLAPGKLFAAGGCGDRTVVVESVREPEVFCALLELEASPPKVTMIHQSKDIQPHGGRLFFRPAWVHELKFGDRKTVLVGRLSRNAKTRHVPLAIDLESLKADLWSIELGPPESYTSASYVSSPKGLIEGGLDFYAPWGKRETRLSNVRRKAPGEGHFGSTGAFHRDLLARDSAVYQPGPGWYEINPKNLQGRYLHDEPLPSEFHFDFYAVSEHLGIAGWKRGEALYQIKLAPGQPFESRSDLFGDPPPPPKRELLTFEKVPLRLMTATNNEEPFNQWHAGPKGINIDYLVSSPAGDAFTNGADVFLRSGNAIPTAAHFRSMQVNPPGKTLPMVIRDIAPDLGYVWLATEHHGIIGVGFDGKLVKHLKDLPWLKTTKLHVVGPGKLLAFGFTDVGNVAVCVMIETEQDPPKINVFHRADSSNRKGDPKTRFAARWLHELKVDPAKRVLLVGRSSDAKVPLTIDLDTLEVGLFREMKTEGESSASFYSSPKGLVECSVRGCYVWPAASLDGKGKLEPEYRKANFADGYLGMLIPYEGKLYVPGKVWARIDPATYVEESLVTEKLPDEYQFTFVGVSQNLGLVGWKKDKPLYRIKVEGVK